MKRQMNKFVEDFCNWKKALEKLEEHDRSDMHKEAVLKQAAYSSSIDIGAQINQPHVEEQRFHQRMLLKLMSSIRFLAHE